MNRIFKRLPLAVAVSMALPVLAQAQETRLGSVVVTAPVPVDPVSAAGVESSSPHAARASASGAAMTRIR